MPYGLAIGQPGDSTPQNIMTTNKGIDYGLGQSNRNRETGIRNGVIHQNDVGQAWFDASEPYYGKPEEFTCPECNQDTRINTKGDPKIQWGDTVECPNCGHCSECELPDCSEPISHYYEQDGYSAEAGECGDIFVCKSPYFTYAQFCSPCAPGACYLMNWLDGDENCETNKAYCFGHDWFDDNKAPYPVYSVETGELVNP